MKKLKNGINCTLAILTAVTSLNLSPILAVEQSKENTAPATTEVAEETETDSKVEISQEKQIEQFAITESKDKEQQAEASPNDTVDIKTPSLNENLGNEPPKKEIEKTEAPKIVSKNEDGSYTDINTNEKISADRVQIQMINPLESLGVEIWVKSETDGTYSKKMVSELTDYEKEKYADVIEQALKPTTFGLRSSVMLSVGDYTGYSVNVTAADGIHGDWSSNYQILLIDGEPGFCVQPGIIFQPGNDFTPSNYEQHELSVIAYEGWYKSDKSMEAYLATQLMIWEYLGGRINSTSFSAYSTYKSAIQNKVNHHFDEPSFPNSNYEINVGESITIHDSNNVLNEFFIEDADGLDVRISSNDLIVTGTIGAKDDSTIELKKIADEYVGTSIVYRKPGSQEAASFKVDDPIVVNLNVKVNKFGSLLISKQDEDGSKVSNTSFLVSRNAEMSSPLGTYTTGNDGTVKVDDILPGTIYVKETSVPAHLVLNSTVYPVTINPNATTTHSLTNNYKKGRISLIKNDSENNVQVGGAVYGVYNASGTEVQRLTTSTTSAVLSGYLRYGDYTVKEISSPVEYNLNPAVYNVQIRNNDQVISVNAKDTPVKGKVEIQKKDIDTGKNVLKANAQFDIYKTNGTFMETVTTNANGTAISSLLRYGDYFFIEKLAPGGYTKNANRTYFNIRTHGVTVKQSISNKRVTGSITINKVDGVTGVAQGDATLEGAVYGLYAYNTITSPDDNHVIYAKDKLISRLTIKNGSATINNLYLGNYYVKEITPSPGYNLDTNSYVISLNYADQNTINIYKNQTVKERIIAQAFEIIKVASNGDNVEVPLVEGAEFTIKLQSDVIRYGSWEAAPVAKNAQGKPASVLVTDFKGYALSQELPYGTYVVRETKVPDNLKPCKDFIVTINKDSRVPQTWRVMNDTPFEAMLKVVKYDSETNEAISLSNATFKIKNLSTGEYLKQWIWYPIPHEIDEFTTGSDGSFYTPALMMYGKYQLEEIKTPNGYLTLENPVQFEIGDAIQVEIGPDGKTPVIKVEVANDPIKGQISLKKEAEVFKGYDFRATEFGNLYEPIFEKGLLAGVNYQITAAEDILTNDKTLWYEKGDIVDDFVTTDAEYLSALLPLGEYNLQEIETVDGYVLDDTIYNISITAEDNVTKVILHAEEKWNEKQRGSISFEKALEESAYIDVKEAYKDITFGLFAEEAILVDGEEVVPTDGLLAVIGLNESLQGTFGLDFEGKYYIKELTTNNHYVLDDSKYSFEYVYNNETLTELKLDKVIENKLKRGSIELQKTENKQNEVLAGATFVLADDQEFKNILFEKISDENGKLSFENLEIGTYYLKETKAPDNYLLDPTVHEIVIGDDELNIQINVVNLQKGSITIHKSDNKKSEPLKGAEFVLASDNEFKEIIQTGMTDETGTIRFDHLDHGKYFYKETKAPDNYMLDTMVYEVLVNEDTTDIEVDVVNLQKGSLTIHKSDNENLEALEGAEFVLGSDNEFKEIIQTGTTDKSGTVRFDHLEHGQYFFKESKAPKGFELDTTVHEIVIDEVTTDIEVEHINTKIRGFFEIIKTSNEPYPFIQNVEDIPEYLESLKDDNSTVNEVQKFYLEGVEFVVAKDDEFNEIIQTGTTDENGKLRFENLEEGTYYWKESKCLDGFVLDTTVHEIVITKHGQHETYELENTVRRSWIEVYKEDEFTKRKLPNAGFTLYSDPDCTIELKKAISGLDGIAVFDGLLNGIYYFKETSAPNGFLLSDEVVKVVIDTDTPPKAYKIIYYNTMLPSSSAPNTGVAGNEMNIMLSMFLISAMVIVFIDEKRRSVRKNGKQN